MESDPLFDNCICTKDLKFGYCAPEQVMPTLDRLSEHDGSPDVMRIAICNGKIVISGNDSRLVNHLKSVGITPKQMKIDVCG